jgi:hypothetical protein
MTGLGRHDILARHKQESGMLKGKILSDTTIPVKPVGRLVFAHKFIIPDTKGAFKGFCQREFKVGVKNDQRLPAAVEPFISRFISAQTNYTAMLLDLTYQSGPEIFLVVKAPGHWDANKFVSREAQARFDDMTYQGKAEIDNCYRFRRYELTAILFETMEDLDAFAAKHYENKGGVDELKKGDMRPMKQLIEADTLSLNRRLPEKWFSGRINHIVPEEWVQTLDEDAIELLFPPGIIDRIMMRRSKAAKLVIPPESKATMLAEVKAFYKGAAPTASDDELLSFHEQIPDRSDVEYGYSYAMSVKMKCDLAVEVRTAR